MDAEFVQGNNVDMTAYTPGAEVAAGEVVVIGSQCRISHRPIATGELGALARRGGEYLVTKAAGASTAIAAGVQVFWNDTANAVTDDDSSGTHKPLGYSLTASLDADTQQRIEHIPN